MRVIPETVPVLILAVVCACGGGHDGHHPPEHEARREGPAEQSDGLELNGDEKWEMDDHTRAMFAVMVERVEGQDGEVERAEELGRALRKDIDELIKGCTMTGDAHGELHKFLVAFMPAVEELASSGGENEMRAVQGLLDAYPRYFE